VRRDAPGARRALKRRKKKILQCVVKKQINSDLGGSRRRCKGDWRRGKRKKPECAAYRQRKGRYSGDLDAKDMTRSAKIPIPGGGEKLKYPSRGEKGKRTSPLRLFARARGKGAFALKKKMVPREGERKSSLRIH